jgi:signal transduction histidine kinase
MKDWSIFLYAILLFIPAFMGALSYLSYLREKDTHLRNLTEFWASIGFHSLLNFFFRENMDSTAAISMMSWLWMIRTLRLVLEDISGQKIFKRWHYITIGGGAFLTFALGGYGVPFLYFTLPLSIALGGVGMWAIFFSFKKTSKENLTSLHVASFILFGLFFIKILTFPIWRLNQDLILFGIFTEILFSVGFAGTGLSTYLEFLKTNHKKFMDKVLKDRSERILVQSRYFEFGILFGGLSHEINNPLTVIKARAMMLQRILDRPEKKEDMLHGLDQIITSVDKITKILSRTKEYLVQDQNGSKEEIFIKALFDDVLSFYGQRLKNHGINIRFYGVEDKKIFCLKTEIEQVIINLLSNSLDAIEFLPDKWIEISCFEKPDSIWIQVEDSGSGIPDDIANQMMEPFFSTKDKDKGTGMGLYFAKESLRKHGGDLRYVPNRKHTTFLIEFPKVRLQEWDMVLH